MTTTKYVSNGTYGCVMRPNIPCSKSDKTDANYVSKLFKIDKHSKEEYIQQKQIENIDKNSSFSLKMHKTCNVEKTQIPENELKKCKNFSMDDLKKNNYNSITYDYGGQALHIAAKTVPPEILFADFQQLIKGLIILKEKELIHSDIKPENIVYNKDTRKMALIDYGLLTKFKDIYTPHLHYLHKHLYLYYPPEFKIFFLLSTNSKVTSKFIVENFKYMFDSKLYVNKSDILQFINTQLSILIKEAKDAKDLKDLSRLFKPKKIDIFSLGITMMEVLSISYSHFKMNKEFVNNLVNVIKDMVDPNSQTRTTPEKALIELKRILKSPSPKRVTPRRLTPLIPKKSSKKTKTMSPLKSPCKPGEELVGPRCFKICKPGTTRNPITNRCKKNVDVENNNLKTKNNPKKVCKPDEELVGTRCAKLCKPGTIRNPITNRCNKVK